MPCAQRQLQSSTRAHGWRSWSAAVVACDHGAPGASSVTYTTWSLDSKSSHGAPAVSWNCHRSVITYLPTPLSSRRTWCSGRLISGVSMFALAPGTGTTVGPTPPNGILSGSMVFARTVTDGLASPDVSGNENCA